MARTDFSDHLRKIKTHYKRIGYNLNVMRQSACLGFNPITVNKYASLFNCTPVGRASDSMMARLKAIQMVGTVAFSSVVWPTGVQLVILFYVRFSVVLFDFPGISSCKATLSSPRL